MKVANIQIFSFFRKSCEVRNTNDLTAINFKVVYLRERSAQHTAIQLYAGRNTICEQLTGEFKLQPDSRRNNAFFFFVLLRFFQFFLI